MATEYHFGMAFGVPVTRGMLKRQFGVDVKETAHYERRYDSKTGKRVADERVVDEPEHFEFEFRGQGFGEYETDELASCIASDIGCSYDRCSSAYGTEDGDEVFVFGPLLPEAEDDGFDDCHVSACGSIGLKHVANPKFLADVENIRRRLVEIFTKFPAPSFRPVAKVTWDVG